MPAIGIIDDRVTLRQTLARRLSTVLPATGWEGIPSDPLADMSLYPSWITENEVVALILDERLHEQAPDVLSHVTYSGHNLVDFIRNRFATLPIFIVTSFPPDESLKSRFKDVEAIIGRSEFLRDADEWVPRIIRSSQKYFETIQGQLSELADVSLKIASGTASEEDEDKARALQSALHAPFIIDQLGSKSDWLTKLEEKLRDFMDLKDEIDNYLVTLRNDEVDKGS